MGVALLSITLELRTAKGEGASHAGKSRGGREAEVLDLVEAWS